MRRGRGPGEASPRPDAGWEAAVAAQGGGEDLDDAEPLHGSEAAKEGGLAEGQQCRQGVTAGANKAFHESSMSHEDQLATAREERTNL